MFDLVIVDPPSFAKSAAEVEAALAAYARLTRLALGVLEPMGVLVMASCSSRVSADDFYATVTAGGQRCRAALARIPAQRPRARPPDHVPGRGLSQSVVCQYDGVNRRHSMNEQQLLAQRRQKDDFFKNPSTVAADPGAARRCLTACPTMTPTPTLNSMSR